MNKPSFINIEKNIIPPDNSSLKADDYKNFLTESYFLLSRFPFFSPDEDINSLELAHLNPEVPETVIAVYLGINDACCNKGLVAPFLVRHGHNNVFVFDPTLYSGGENVPAGTIDAKNILNGFEPPNETWDSDWTYVMIKNPAITYMDLWAEKGYIDMIAAKFEDFTMMSDPGLSKLCVFINEKAFNHPVNISRNYLTNARKRGEKMVNEFIIPEGLEGEVDDLVPIILNQGEKLYIATKDFGPCDHAWSNIHPQNKEWAVIEENSAVPLNLVVAKPAISEKYKNTLRPALGSADMTTDWFFRHEKTFRKPILFGQIKG